nr:PTS system mannose/fructose/sorbose family transporter subunit IID [Escherichia coli]
MRSNLQQASFNFERIHGLGFCHDMMRAIKRLYPLKEEPDAALRRPACCHHTPPSVVCPSRGVPSPHE